MRVVRIDLVCALQMTHPTHDVAALGADETEQPWALGAAGIQLHDLARMFLRLREVARISADAGIEVLPVHEREPGVQERVVTHDLEAVQELPPRALHAFGEEAPDVPARPQIDVECVRVGWRPGPS